MDLDVKQLGRLLTNYFVLKTRVAIGDRRRAAAARLPCQERSLGALTREDVDRCLYS